MQNDENIHSWCLIPEPVQARGDGLRPSTVFTETEAIEKQVERLSSAVRVATESWDDNGNVDVDPRWGTFDEFHQVLKGLFPLVYDRRELLAV